MKSEHENKSTWQDEKIYTPVNKWDKERVYDVLITGNDITALTTALVLQQEGIKCIVASPSDTFCIKNTSASFSYSLLHTLRETAELQPANAVLLATGIREGIDLAEGLINKYHIDCNFLYDTGYLFSQNEEEQALMNDLIRAAQKAGIVCMHSDTLPISVPFDSAARFEFYARLNTMAYLNGLAKAFENEGGVILSKCAIYNLENNGYLSTDTIYGTVRAKKAIITTDVSPNHPQFNIQYFQRNSFAIAFTLKSGAYPDGITYDMKDPDHYFTTEEVNGKKYLVVGVAGQRTANNTKAGLIQLEAFARAQFKIDRAAYQWCHPYYESLDGLPCIGRAEGNKAVFMARYMGNYGMAFNSLSAKVLCGLITGKGTPYEDLFKPGRQMDNSRQFSLPAA